MISNHHKQKTVIFKQQVSSNHGKKIELNIDLLQYNKIKQVDYIN